MDHAAQVLENAHEVYARSGASVGDPNTRPPVFKAIGIGLAIGSGAFIGTSFVLKKAGLLKANEKYNEVAGEGYGYLKNTWWWGGMILMIIGEIMNFAAYAFTDAILVTPLGALSVVITAILSAIFLKERLSMVGKVACFLCIVGSIVIVMNAPSNSSVATIEQMQSFVVTPGFLSYAGVVLLGSAVVAFWLGPKYGKKNMLVYISVCSWVGGLSVVATQGLGAAIITQASGKAQFNQWFTYVLLVFVISTLLVEIVFLNKALNLFNAALVTPTYYVYFTSTTIITSSVLFQGFKGTPSSIITVINGFLTICAGVVLLQLSKSAKDVPDAAVFAGDLDQIRSIAEQEQPETEPKADAIRGAAAIVRRLSSARMRMEYEELRRLNEEKRMEALEPLSEDGTQQYEWDGLRRRKTIMGSQRARAMTSPSPFPPPMSTANLHPPLGWSHFPTEEELREADRPSSPALSSIVGTIRNRARSILTPINPQFADQDPSKTQSPVHPVQLTEVVVPSQSGQDSTSYQPPGPPFATRASRSGSGVSNTSSARRVQFMGERGRDVEVGDNGLLRGPTPPPHSARRQFSFQNIFRRQQGQTPVPTQDHGGDGALDRQRPLVSSRGYSSPQTKDATEEERLGLVKGDSRGGSGNKSMPVLPRYDSYDDNTESFEEEAKVAARYGPSITHTPPRRGSPEKEEAAFGVNEVETYEQQRQRFHERSRSREADAATPPRPPPHSRQPSRQYSPPNPRRDSRGGAGSGSFI
ncbi:magnesium transporter NIPA-domain-containing protein [Podospora conica]|nr:magnesium transporter NIPA-domain-containing protein [Schizothecium conicum]